MENEKENNYWKEKRSIGLGFLRNNSDYNERTRVDLTFSCKMVGKPE